MHILHRRTVRIGIAACVAILVLIANNSSNLFRKTPDLNEVGKLAKDGRFDLAANLVGDYLSESPDNARARLIAAELALDQPKPLPRVALEHLGRVATPNPGIAAVAKLDEGKAAYMLGLYGRAEICWLRAIRLDPRVPEAAWALLDLYYLEGRGEEARALAVNQYKNEPDPHDRVHLLLELVRQDAEPPQPSSVAERLTTVVRPSFRETKAAIALGLALVHDSRPDQGLKTLQRIVERHPNDPVAWDALLTGLDDSGRAADLPETLKTVPDSLADEPRLLHHRGKAAQEQGDRPRALEFYRRAWKDRPDDFVSAYRLGLLLHATGNPEEANPVDAWTRSAEAARDAILDLFRDANAIKDLGTAPHISMYRQLADNRERLGRKPEARAWLALILEIRPDDAASLTSLGRLK